jgi:regulatory protein SWI5
MLSNPINNLQNRQRQHRRQNSTPTAFEPVKVNSLPNIQRNGVHRRGMSLDTRRRRQTPPQDNTVSTTNNQGYQTTPQHILREAQQQRLARPGQQQFTTYENDENYLSSPIVTPQKQTFDTGCTNQYGERGTPSEYLYPGPINTINNISPSAFNGATDFNLFSTDGSLTPSAFLDFSAGFEQSNGNEVSNSGNHSRRSSGGRRISGGIVDRVAKFEQLALQSPEKRPITPPNQNVSSMFCSYHSLTL